MSLESIHDHTMTLEEWAALPDDEEGELVDGRLVEEEQVTVLHSVVATWLSYTLEGWAQQHGAFVGGDNTKIKVAPRRGRKPDLWVYLAERTRPRIDAPLVTALPSIVVEIVSKERNDARRDRIDKMGDYARAGIPWYWLVDPQLRTFEIFELGKDGRCAIAAGASEGRIATIPGCEGLVLDLDALWRRGDAFPGE
jgi:Uma2 family endonuclease